MSSSIARNGQFSGTPGGDRTNGHGSRLRDQVQADIDRALSLLRKAINDRGWSLEALAAHMGIDRAHVSRVLLGEKSLTLAFEVALPDDVEALYKQYRAESFGLIVVEQCDEETARRQFASGLFNLLTTKRSELPAKTSGPIKAELLNRRASDRERVG